ncbi:hypothetical protein GFC29_3342 [Anoxybacillus sp. B7M1]|jgi:hypothetical protein|uniref:DUF3147 family protein n=1 Tax=Anoxybacteroides rupiense TaxID=311460 RepID=A0ABT5W1Z0_9BACL|nr:MULTISPECIES: DUF3147 family protein [Anoxybacillus]ANB58979.1 hypothetical protein GFC28_2092 [Anoxybacillus sp. B2M1]ANB64599.1 hypothetical protein GFC29_3342 [Anoxybacillus sp. B7M1]KXG10925.1 hypothetical protein AT864_00793 [Anoxybacillus sp. P3H1B]MBB3907881.1 hypothetical protein [Anoxybacillus rupiensis]MDE8563344.1 DUF3147 family protein [Anoxybacillus rupiensis]
MFSLVKIVISAIMIGIVTEVARRFPTFGGAIAALPLVSLLSLCWLYVQGEPTKRLSEFAFGVLWGLPATACLLLIVALSLRASFPLALSIGLGVAAWSLFLAIQKLMAHS